MKLYQLPKIRTGLFDAKKVLMFDRVNGIAIIQREDLKCVVYRVDNENETHTGMYGYTVRESFQKYTEILIERGVI